MNVVYQQHSPVCFIEFNSKLEYYKGCYVFAATLTREYESRIFRIKIDNNKINFDQSEFEYTGLAVFKNNS